MTSTASLSSPRRVPPLGGFSVTMLRLELRRMLRNRRTVIFTLVLPVVFFLLFGTGHGYEQERAGVGNVTAYVLVSLAVYGAILAGTSAGATVSIERAAGWSRQLRLTPLRPAAYVTVKLVVAMVLAAVSVLATYVAGVGSSQMPAPVWVETAVLGWAGRTLSWDPPSSSATSARERPWASSSTACRRRTSAACGRLTALGSGVWLFSDMPYSVPEPHPAPHPTPENLNRGADDIVGDQTQDRREKVGHRRQPGQLSVGHALQHE